MRRPQIDGVIADLLRFFLNGLQIAAKLILEFFKFF
jgi:hypothetical protein